MTYLQDKGGSVTLDRRTIAASSCNEAGTVLVESFGQYDCILEGERVDRLDRDVRHGRIGHVEACMLEASDDDAGPGDSGYAVAHVRVVPSAAFHFDLKTGAYVADEQ